MICFRVADFYTTYSIVARDPHTGELGVAVQTHQMSVGRVVPWLQPGVGAIATQSLANVSFGPMGLALLREGIPAPRVIDALVASDSMAFRRQLAIVDAHGRAGAFTGHGCIREAGHHIGEGYSVQANMMTRETVIDAMRTAYESAIGNLAERMIAALYAAQSEDGDIRGMQSAALVVVPSDALQPAWKTLYDLRVDEHQTPLGELNRLVRLRKASLTNDEGESLLEIGDVNGALAKFKEARDIAPQDEELAFWQAVLLADVRPTENAVSIAGHIIKAAMDTSERAAHWEDLLHRLQECGLIVRPNAATELIAAWKES